MQTETQEGFEPPGIHNECQKKSDSMVTIIPNLTAAICLNIDAQCNLYVCDFTHHRIIKIDRSNNIVGWIGQRTDQNVTESWTSQGQGMSGFKLGAFNQPHSVDFDQDGNLYVGEYFNNRVQKFSPAGVVVGSFGILPTGEFKEGFTTDETVNTEHASGVMKGIATAYFGNDGYMYLTDYDGNAVVRITTDGKFSGWIGMNSDQTTATSWQMSGTPIESSIVGGFNKPHATVLDQDRNLYIADTWNHRILKYTAEGTFVGWIGERDNGTLTEGWEESGMAKQTSVPGGFGAPTSINLDKNGDLIIAEYANHRIQKFGVDGKFQGWIGCDQSNQNTGLWRMDGFSQSGSEPGCFMHPYDARAIGNRLFVADTHNDRVQIIDLEYENVRTPNSQTN
jgi:DNA-binding beta-propeller fold protein YncE